MLLEMKNISKSFFGKNVLENIDLTIKPNSIHALLGENGAGKTTLMNILYGLYQADTGDIFIDGNKVSIDSPNDALTYRIGMVHQHFQLVDKFTVSKNITLGLKNEKGYPILNRKNIDSKISSLSKKYGLLIDPKRLIKDLSVGEQQRVEIIKLLYRDVELLIFDEPTAVLTPEEVGLFFRVLKELKKQGHSIIIITHKVQEIFDISDSITVLRAGEKIVSCDIEDTNEDQVSEYMIGRKLVDSNFRESSEKFNEKCLSIESISVKNKGIFTLKNVYLDINKGEVLGIAGVDSNGQKELAEVIAGIEKPDSGDITLDNESILGLSISNRYLKGVRYIPEDRHSDAIVSDMDLKDNIFLKKHFESSYKSKGFINEKILESKTNKLIEQYDIKSPGASTLIRYLSGGNQQKLVVARELEGELKLLIAFQPTRGLDVGATEYIHNLLCEISKEGVAVLLISTDLNELIKLSDNICVMYDGNCSKKIENDDRLDINLIGKMMAGIDFF
ncbi:ABC transporter ATP-binding protein [Miniphocaeibacter massiliensis]|uniref:ABC transporter ATP-binding protein n=1 Tax=Miniphocaeibacter massiliensis TaxID=2041841 RepID=UPI000C1C764F|nr:ABC transporter ATP-binding protein [Miniphocaeibacter massiliensis]